MNSELIINSTKDGKAKQQTIPNINPDVANSIAGAFAEKCVAMSTESYSSANVVRKSDVTEEYSGGGGGATEGLLNPNLRRENFFFYWEGDGVCEVIGDTNSVSKGEAFPFPPGSVAILESDGVYAKDWLVAS